MIIIYIILLLGAIVFYTIPIAKSQTINKDEYHPSWMENSIYLATVSVTLIFFLGVFDYLISSYFNAGKTISSSSFWDYIKELSQIAGGLKRILIIFISSQLASLVITSIVISISEGFKELRKTFIIIAGIYLIVLFILIVGFEIFTKRIASVLGIISTIIGILISLKTLSKRN